MNHNFLKILAIITILHESFSREQNEQNGAYKEDINCKLNHCQEASDQVVTVYLSGHSHLDGFWLQNFEEYYNGNGHDGIHRWINVKKLFTGVVEALNNDQNRTHAFAEISYFKRWYEDVGEQLKNQAQKVIMNGQLEFINGGWIQNDQGCPYYDDMIDQIMIGHQYLYEKFNIIPNVAFNVDNFGHSSAQAALYSQMGFNAYVVARLTTSDLNTKRDQKKLEFLWEPQFDTGVFKDSIFTHLRFKRHAPWPFHNELLYRQGCSQLEGTFSQFEGIMKEIHQGIDGDTIFHYAGDDFQFFDENRFQSLEKLINYYYNNPCKGFNVKFSNFTSYFQERLEYFQQHKDQVWQTQKLDFFPYQEDGLYWTGYFTSYPRFKFLVRQSSRFLQSYRKLMSNMMINRKLFDFQLQSQDVETTMLKLEQEVALAQHHDGITATSQYIVHDDVEERIDRAIKPCYQQTLSATQQLVKTIFPAEIFGEDVAICDYLDDQEGVKCFENFIETTQYKSIFLVIYNPAESREEVLVIQAPNPSLSFQIVNQINTEIPIEIICEQQGGCMVYFQLNIPAYSHRILKVTQKDISQQVTKDRIYFTEIEVESDQEPIINLDDTSSLKIQNSQKDFVYNSCIKQSDLDGCVHNFSIDFFYYNGISKQSWSTWEGGHFFQASNGKYIIMNDPSSYRIISAPTQLFYAKTNLVTVVQIHYSQQVKLEMRFYPWKRNKGIELFTFFATSQLSTGQRDFIMQIQSKDINNNQIMYTDANGLFMLKRQYRQREDYKPVYNDTDQFGGNTYPMTAISYLEDQVTKKRMVVITDRPQGVASLNPGELQINIDRLAGEDGRGVGQYLTRADDQYLKHVLLFTKDVDKDLYRITQQIFDQTLLKITAQSATAEFDLQNSHINLLDLEKIAPTDSKNHIKIITRPYQTGRNYLIRIQNIQENVQAQYQLLKDSQVTALTFLSNGLNKHQYKKITEYALNGARSLQQTIKNQWHWNHTKEDSIPQNFDDEVEDTITLKPLQIRTFLVEEFESIDQTELKNDVLSTLQIDEGTIIPLSIKGSDQEDEPEEIEQIDESDSDKKGKNQDSSQQEQEEAEIKVENPSTVDIRQRKQVQCTPKTSSQFLNSSLNIFEYFLLIFVIFTIASF